MVSRLPKIKYLFLRYRQYRQKSNSHSELLGMKFSDRTRMFYIFGLLLFSFHHITSSGDNRQAINLYIHTSQVINFFLLHQKIRFTTKIHLQKFVHRLYTIATILLH